MQGKKQQQEQFFLSVQLSDLVQEDNFYRMLKKVLEPQMQFLYKDTKYLYGDTGNPGIDPVVFFKLILVAYLENIVSDRKLVKMSAMRLDILFFLGYHLGESLPFHSTISWTRQLYPKELFERLFNQVFGMCVQAGMVGGTTQSVDSALVKANASVGSMELKQPQMSVEQFMQESDKENKLPEKETPVSTTTPLTVESKNTDSNNEQKKSHTSFSNETHYSPSDPDSKLSKKPGKPLNMNYLAGMSTDTDSRTCGIISHIQADFADEGDTQHLIDITEKTKARLEDHDLHLANILADTNFSNGENYQYLEKEGIVGFIPPQAGYKHEMDFIYDEENDTFICQNNQVLNYTRTIITKRGQSQKEYKSTWESCDTCPFRSTCLAKRARSKRITVTAYRKEYGAAYERVRTKEGKRMKKLRSSTVEPVFGSLINYFGMKQVNAKGIEAANKAVLGAAMAYNLKKLLKFTIKTAKSEAKALRKELCNKGIMLLNDFVTLFLEKYIPLTIMEFINS
jgi:transposase